MTAIADLTCADLSRLYRWGVFCNDWLNWSPYSYPFNLTQQPAASVPCGLAANGLPMGDRLSAR